MTLAQAIFAALAATLVACSPSAPSSASKQPQRLETPARAVPTTVLTLASAGKEATVEAGDVVEVRLPAKDAWQHKATSGDAKIESLGGPQSATDDAGLPILIFRFKTSSAGRASLAFSQNARAPAQDVTFDIVVR